MRNFTFFDHETVDTRNVYQIHRNDEEDSCVIVTPSHCPNNREERECRSWPLHHAWTSAKPVTEYPCDCPFLVGLVPTGEVDQYENKKFVVHCRVGII
jgi:hypothetical protein